MTCPGRVPDCIFNASLHGTCQIAGNRHAVADLGMNGDEAGCSIFNVRFHRVDVRRQAGPRRSTESTLDCRDI